MKKLKPLFLIVLFIITIKPAISQSKSNNLEIGYKNFNSTNFYLGFKKNVFKNENIFLRGGVNKTFFPTNQGWDYTENKHMFFLNAGAEYRFLKDIKFITPYAGLDIIYNRTMINRTYQGFTTNSNYLTAKFNYIGPAGFIGVRFNLKDFYAGCELDYSYCLYTEKWVQGVQIETYKGWRHLSFRKPLVYIGYQF